MRKSISAPAYAPNLVTMPKVKVSPINNNPSIKSQSTAAIPAKEWKKSAKGPMTPNFRKPVVGEPPESQALSHIVVTTLVAASRQVENPKPQTLSANAHRKSKPILNLKIPKIALNLFDSIPFRSRSRPTDPA